MEKKSDIDAHASEDLQRDTSYADGVSHVDTRNHDAVFGEITKEGPNYRNVGWLGTAGIMMKAQLGLGVLSFPAAFNTLGLIPGIICLVSVAIITTWSDYMVGVFKLNHRHVYGIDDAGMLMFGRVGREVLGTAYCLFCTFCAGSAFIGISIGLNAVSHHATCTAVFVIVAALISFGLSSIRTLGRIAGLAWLGLICLVVAILVVTFAVGFQDRPAAAPQSGPWDSDFKLFKNPPFTAAISAVSTMCFAYAGGPFFFGMIAEMKEPRHFTRSLMLCQITVTSIYIAVSSVVYYYCGSYVASPALGSAGVHIKKIAYGLALPGLFISATLLSHMPAKYIFVRLLRGSKHLTSNSITHWSTWLGCTFSIMLAGYLIASGIPVFNELVSLVGALLGTFVSWQPMGCMWLYDNWNRDKSQRNAKWKAMVGWCMFVIGMGTFLMIAGTYGSIVAIVDSYKKSGGSAAWSCADNSNSV